MAEVFRRYSIEGFDEAGFDVVVGQELPTEVVPPPPVEGGPIILFRVASTESDVIDLYFSYSHPESLVDGIHYRPIIDNVGYVERNLNEGSGTFGANVIPTIGNIDLSLRGGRDDDLCAVRWKNRFCELAVGRRDINRQSSTSYTTVFRGRTRNANWTTDQIRIEIGDNGERLRFIPNTSTYTGTGGLEGTAELKDKPRPRLLGNLSLITPQLVDPDFNVYQVSFQRVTFSFILERMRLFQVIGRDITNLGLPNVYAWTPVAGQLVTDASQGLFRLGTTAQGRIAAVAQGLVDNDFVPHAVIRGLMAIYAPNIPINSASIAALFPANQASVGLYLDVNDTRTFDAVLDELVLTMNAFWTFSRGGVFEVHEFKFRNPIAALNDSDFGRTLHRVRESEVVWEVKVRYNRNYAVHAESDIAPLGATQFNRVGPQVEWNVETLSDPQIRIDNPGALSVTIDSLHPFISAPALALAQKVFNLRKVPREIYGFTVEKRNNEFNIGDTVTLQSSRFALDKDMIIIRTTERFGEQITDVECWG